MRPINPHLDMAPYIRHLPAGHPARETEMLTPFQQMAFPTLLWFFDNHRHRGEGRSTLMAHVAIELAMRGHRVPLEDFSQFLLDGGDSMHHRSFFMDLIARIAHEHYPGYIFDIGSVQNFRHGNGTLVYVGRRPR